MWNLMNWSLTTTEALIVLCCLLSGIDGNCGYKSCNLGRPDVLNVHLVSHTHDDVGWLKTVDQYFYGDKDGIQAAGVQYILDTVVRALMDNRERRFSYVEIAYFSRWWRQQSLVMRARVRGLVNEGRLQFLLGGWVMNDEATTHYSAIIDQHSLGLGFLEHEFGRCGRPLVAWQIDPFGHSIEQANLFAEMGYDALFFSRLDYRDRDQRIASRRMEFLQRGDRSTNASYSNTLFTSILYNSYTEPSGFCFDDKCSDTPIIDSDDPDINNVDNLVSKFVDYIKQYRKPCQTNHVLITMGNDFRYQNAFHSFVNIDKLIKYTNQRHKEYNLFYSTPSCYTYAVNKAGKNFTQKTDDFFPYASAPHSYWTGYFSSRAALKGFTRMANSVFQSCKKLYALSGLRNSVLSQKLQQMTMQMGVMQHHDAVTGTEKQVVAYDYAKYLFNGLDACGQVMNVSVNRLLRTNTDYKLCPLLNISACAVSDNIPVNGSISLVLHNPQAQQASLWVRLPVTVAPGDRYSVVTGSTVLKSQLVPISKRTRSIPERNKSLQANNELVFEASLTGLGLKQLIVVRNRSSTDAGAIRRMEWRSVGKGGVVTVENEKLRLTYENGIMVSVENKKLGLKEKIRQLPGYYTSVHDSVQSSGAYIFRPVEKSARPLANCSLKVSRGPLVVELEQRCGEWVVLVTRLYSGSNMVETEWTVGPIPVSDKVGKEVVLSYEAGDWHTEQRFYTDSNGRQLLQRQLNNRSDYAFNQTEPVAGNFYPVTSAAMLADEKRAVALIVYTDRAQGAGSHNTGVGGLLELMIHRRCLYDDGFGVGEALNEVGLDGKGLVVRGRHFLRLDKTATLLAERRQDELKLFGSPQVLLGKGSSGPRRDLSPLAKPLPAGLHILSLEIEENHKDRILLRLENLGGSALTIDLTQLFQPSSVVVRAAQELTLAANQVLASAHRLPWHQQDGSTTLSWSPRIQESDSSLVVKVNSEQIRTFRLTVKVL